MCSTGELVRRLGGALAGAVATLDEPEVGVGSSLAADYLALREHMDRLDALSLRWLAALDADGIGAVDGSVSTAAWVRRHTGGRGVKAAVAVRLARRLHTDASRGLTATAQLLTAGRLSVDHAEVIARATATLTPAAFATFEPLIAEAATTLGADAAGQVATAVADHAAELHAAGTEDPAAERRAQVEANRRLHLSRVGDRYALDATLTLEAGEMLKAVLEPLSEPLPTVDGMFDKRTAAQRRADALTEAARRLLSAGELPVHGGQRPQLTVLVDLDRLGTRTGSGRFPGGARLSAAATERIGCDPTLGWIATTSSDTPRGRTAGRELIRQALQQISPALGGIASQVLDAGRSRRLVTPAQRRALTLRDRGCVFPGCDRPPPWCEAHHLIHWSAGGPTDLHNLALLCAGHHTTVHDHGWTLARAPDGTVTAQPPRLHRTRRPSRAPRHLRSLEE